MNSYKKTLLALVLFGAGAVAGAALPTGAQVANSDQRVVRALETQATALKAMARSLAKMERCK